MKNLHVVNHPFVIDSLTHLRDKQTSIPNFRRHSNQICKFLVAEAIRGLEFREVEIETPLTKTKQKKLSEEVVVAPVLRSGTAMLFGALDLLPKSKVGFLGVERDEKTAIAHEYYCKLPKIDSKSVVLILDPMLATGGSILHFLKKIKGEKPEHSAGRPKEVRIVCVVAAPEGVEKIHQEFPEVQIFTAALDEKLNDKKFIVPGLGDYGDRYFGTEGEK